MAKKHNPITYIREKNKVQISGDPADVRAPMWFDLLTSRLIKIVLILAGMRAIWEWVKNLLPFMIFFLATAGYLHLLFSG